MAAEILFEDEDIVVVDKPAGVIVHAAPGHAVGSLADELARRFPEMAGVGSAERPGVVHRLDLETSGVMVFARTQRAYLALRRQFESHRDVRKTYLYEETPSLVEQGLIKVRLVKVSEYEAEELLRKHAK